MIHNLEYDLWHLVGEEKGIGWQAQDWRWKAPKLATLLEGKTRALVAGGNIGMYPRYLSNLFEEVIAMEPVKEYYECLLKNTRNKLNVVPINKGLSNSNTPAKIIDKEIHNCGHTVLEETTEGEISLICLDDLNLTALDLIILDVEGFEKRALEGARKTINLHTPTLIIENNGQCMGFAPLSGHQPSLDFRNWVCNTFNYKFVDHINGDDFFVKEK